MATPHTVRVKMLVTRYIGDDLYGAGNEYAMDPERAARYAARGDLAILATPASTPVEEPAPAPDGDESGAKRADPPVNKMRGRPEDKAG